MFFRAASSSSPSFSSATSAKASTALASASAGGSNGEVISVKTSVPPFARYGSFSVKLYTPIPPFIEEKMEGKDTRHHTLADRKFVFRSGIALINGALYFNIAASGSQNLEKFFNLSHQTAKNITYSLGVGASISNVMFFYKTLEGITLRPESGSAWALTSLAPIAALSFLTAGREGAEFLGASTAVAATFSVPLYALRIVSMIDGSVKFPGRLQEIKSSWGEAFSSRDYKELSRIAVTLYTATAFAASTTDSIYSATTNLGTWFGADENNTALVGFSYGSCVLGAFAIFPFMLYWTHRGIKQITYGGRADASGINKDPTDHFTFVGLVANIPVILAVLGMVTAAEGMAFGKLGVFAITLRLSSALIYSMAAGVPGLSTFFRGIASSCKDSKDRGSNREPSKFPPLFVQS